MIDKIYIEKLKSNFSEAVRVILANKTLNFTDEIIPILLHVLFCLYNYCAKKH